MEGLAVSIAVGLRLVLIQPRLACGEPGKVLQLGQRMLIVCCYKKCNELGVHFDGDGNNVGLNRRWVDDNPRD